MREEILLMRKEHESVKASYFYKAESLEKELQKHVTKKASLKAKIFKIRAVLEALNQMVQSGIKERGARGGSSSISDNEDDFDVINNKDLVKQAKGLAPPKRDDKKSFVERIDELKLLDDLCTGVKKLLTDRKDMKIQEFKRHLHHRKSSTKLSSGGHKLNMQSTDLKSECGATTMLSYFKEGTGGDMGVKRPRSQKRKKLPGPTVKLIKRGRSANP